MTAPVLDEIKRAAHRGWWAVVLRGLLGVVIGVLILAHPLDSVAALALLIAFWALFTGLTEIVRAFEIRSIMQHWWVLLLKGIVSVGFGVAALFYYPGLSLTFAIVLVAWWFTVAGAISLFAAMQEKKLGMQWGWAAIAGVLSIVAGVFSLVAPPATLAAIIAIIAAYAIVSGLALLVAAFQLRALVHSATAPAR